MAAAALTLAACGTSGHSKAVDAGIPVSYSDYYDLCDVYSGELKRGMKIDRTWTKDQHDELHRLVAADPDCQPED